MIGVATGKGAPRNGTDDSEPTETLPMLLKVPMMLDWGGGVTLLGLGDIVLPGLLLSFALRADYMKRASSKWGYYWLMCAGYWLGLIMAIAASRIMQQVQHTETHIHASQVRVWGLGDWVLGSGFWILGSGFWVLRFRFESNVGVASSKSTKCTV